MGISCFHWTICEPGSALKVVCTVCSNFQPLLMPWIYLRYPDASWQCKCNDIVNGIPIRYSSVRFGMCKIHQVGYFQLLGHSSLKGSSETEKDCKSWSLKIGLSATLGTPLMVIHAVDLVVSTDLERIVHSYSPVSVAATYVDDAPGFCSTISLNQ